MVTLVAAMEFCLRKQIAASISSLYRWPAGSTERSSKEVVFSFGEKVFGAKTANWAVL